MVEFSKQNFSFKLETTVKFGVGVTETINDLLAGFSYKKFGLIVDSGVLKGNKKAVDNIVEKIKGPYELLQVLEARADEPDYDYLDECKEEFLKLELDAFIGIGGGSALDLTKGIAVLMTNPGKAITYRGFDLAKNPALPVIAIPTTAGTGSEVTPNAVFIDKKEQRKLGINGEYCRPKVAILDPLLTLSCPKSATISSGMDALTHTMESFVAKSGTPISRVFSREAFSLIFNNLPKLINDLNNIELRSRLLLGSYYAGIALMNAGAGPAGAMSYPLGVHYHIPHGLAGAIFLDLVAKYNVENGCLAYGVLYDLIEGADHSLNDAEKNRRFVKAAGELRQKLALPSSLKALGVTKKDVDALVEETSWLKGALEQNPVPFTGKEVRKMWDSLES